MFGMIATQLETPFIASVTSLVSSIIAYTTGPLQAALILYVALMGLGIISGRAGIGMGTFISSVLKLALVVWFLTGAGIYAQWVQNLFMVVLPNELTTAITGTTAINGNAFDLIWTQAYDASVLVGRGLGTFDFSSMLGIALYLLIALAACVVGFCIYLISHIALGLLIIVGPLLIGLALFPATAAIFQKWVGALIGCLVLQLFVLVLLSLCIKVEGVILGQVASNIGGNAAANLAVLLGGGGAFFGVIVLLTWQLPALANSVSGGLHFHVGGMARTAAQGIRSTGRGSRALVSGTASVGSSTSVQIFRPSPGATLSRTPTPTP